MQMPKIKLSNAIPSIFEINNKRYIVPQWTEVDDTITTEMVRDVWWSQIGKPQNYPNLTKILTFEIPNSKGNGFYTVTYEKNQWYCTCTGFGFRRRCKHIENAKLNLG